MSLPDSRKLRTRSRRTMAKRKGSVIENGTETKVKRAKVNSKANFKSWGVSDVYDHLIKENFPRETAQKFKGSWNIEKLLTVRL